MKIKANNYDELQILLKATQVGNRITPGLELKRAAIAEQTISGAVRLKLLRMRTAIGKAIQELEDARSEIQSRYFMKGTGKERFKMEEYIEDGETKKRPVYKKKMKKEDLVAETKELFTTPIELELNLLTETEFASLKMNDESPLFITDFELNPLLETGEAPEETEDPKK